MPDFSEEDANLLRAVEVCEQLPGLGITAARAQPYGVAVYQRDNVVGIWSFYQGRYLYRSLASWEPIATVATLDMVLQLTQWMGDTDAWTGAPALRGKPH